MAQLSTKGVIFGSYCGMAAIALLLAGCSGGGQGFNTATTSNSALVGTWTRAAISDSSTTVTCPNSLSENNVVVDSCVFGETITFASAGTYTITDPAGKFGAIYTESGTYKYSGASLTLTRLQTDVISGTVTPGTTVNLLFPVVIPNTITLSGTNSFALQPLAPTSGSDYSVPETAEGTTVVSTYTRV